MSQQQQIATPNPKHTHPTASMKTMRVRSAAGTARSAATARPQRLAVVAKASKGTSSTRKIDVATVLPKVEAAVICGAASLVASPAYALVDKRLNGDGTRKALGVNEPILGWVLLGVFTTIWALYVQGTKELGGDKGDDSGLSL